jgi:hypothetical protein
MYVSAGKAMSSWWVGKTRSDWRTAYEQEQPRMSLTNKGFVMGFSREGSEPARKAPKRAYSEDEHAA